jgi:hypothetical protein
MRKPKARRFMRTELRNYMDINEEWYGFLAGYAVVIL